MWTALCSNCPVHCHACTVTIPLQHFSPSSLHQLTHTEPYYDHWSSTISLRPVFLVRKRILSWNTIFSNVFFRRLLKWHYFFPCQFRRIFNQREICKDDETKRNAVLYIQSTFRRGVCSRNKQIIFFLRNPSKLRLLSCNVSFFSLSHAIYISLFYSILHIFEW